MFLSPLVLTRIAFGIGVLINAITVRRFGGLDSLILTHLMLTLRFVISMVFREPRGGRAGSGGGGDGSRRQPLQTFFPGHPAPDPHRAGGERRFAFIISWDQVEASLFLVKT